MLQTPMFEHMRDFMTMRPRQDLLMPNTHRRRRRASTVELSRVELCRRCVRARRLSWPSLQFCSVYVTVGENWKLGHDWRLVRSHRRHDATRLRCRQIVQTRRDSSRLSPTSCEFNTHRRRDSTRQLSCVGGVYWALLTYLLTYFTSPGSTSILWVEEANYSLYFT